MTGDDMRTKIDEVRTKLAALKSIPQPNEPIPEFPILDSAFLNEWDAKLTSVSCNSFIEEVTALLEEVELPHLHDSEPRHD